MLLHWSFPSDISYFWDEYDSAVAPSHAGGFRAIEAMYCEISQYLNWIKNDGYL